MTDLTLVIGNKNYSSWSLRPWLYLKHFDIPFNEVLIPLYSDGYKEKILQYSPSGKVPYLKDGELGVWDSLAIMEYLAEKYPEKKGWPEDLKVRAMARSVSAEMHSGFFALRENMPMNCRKVFEVFVPPENAMKDVERIKDVWSKNRREYCLKGPWIFGEFSIADCMYAPVVMRFHTYSIELNELEKDYIQTMRSHPAIKEWLAASNEETEIIITSEIKVAP
ncbi:glutathione S-transferase family protein [bacterium]|nr:glutathione S-transferase family protein [bacterium]